MGSNTRYGHEGKSARTGRGECDAGRTFSTGDEVIGATARPALGHVRDVNASTLAAVVTAAGGIPVAYGIVGDDLGAIENAARAALAESDALVLSAGSSVSYRDLTARVLEALGRPGILVHGIAIKPRKPTLIAVAGGKPIVGLPGNAAGALVEQQQIRPNERFQHRIDHAVAGRRGMTKALPRPIARACSF